jgi:hypothetical protein
MKINEQEIQTIKSNTTRALNAAMSLEIKSDEDYEKAGELKLNLTKLNKMITGAKEKITKPLNEALKNARELFSPAENSYKTANQLVTRKMIDWDDLREAEANLAKEKIAAKVESGYIKPETAEQKLEEIIEAPQTTISNAGTTYTSKVKKVKIINELLIPREYLIIDMVKLNRAMLKDGLEVAGAEVYEEKRIGGRTA